MAPLNDVIDRRFGWARGVSSAALMTDPALIERLRTSYDEDGGDTGSRAEVEAQDVVIDGSGKVRLYTPGPELRTDRALVWVHGGGFLGGDVDAREADGVARETASRTGATVVSVDYRLARADHHYPHLHREVLAAYRWVIGAQGLAIAPDRVVVGGASAGASLSVAAALEQRDLGGPLPAGLVLAYPMLFRTTPEAALPEDIDQVPEVLRIQQGAVSWMFEAYEGPHHGSAEPTYAALDDADLTGLPPALVIGAEYDDLRGHAEEFVRRARGAGVPVDVVSVSGLPHGHLQFTASEPETERSLAAIADFVGR